MRQLSKRTGHSLSYLRDQLRKFGIQKENSPPALVTFGWDEKDGQLVKNTKEQAALRQILALARSGKGSKSIAKFLNEKAIPTKTGRRWWPSTVRNILARELKSKQKEKTPCPSKN